MYHDGYRTLIRQLTGGERARRGRRLPPCADRLRKRALVHAQKDNFFAWGRSLTDLFARKFCAIHSYVIDRARLGNSELKFDEAFTLLEDYDFVVASVRGA